MSLNRYYLTCGTPKGEPRKRVKARRGRTEASVVQYVRTHDVIRDGHCRIAKDSTLAHPHWFTPEDTNWICEGDSQLMHLEGDKRFKTRGKAPEVRHTTAGTCMGCTKHHDMYDGRRRPRLQVEMLTSAGADGQMRWSLRK